MDIHFLKFLGKYISDRFAIVPWFLLPIYLWYLFADYSEPTPHLLNIFTSLILLFVFRLLDDFFSRSVDKNQGRDFEYLNSDKFDHHLLAIIILSGLLGIFLIYSHFLIFIVYAIIFIGSILLYIIGALKPLIQKSTPVLKYFLIPFLLTSTVNWSVFSAWILSFIVFEIVDSKHKQPLNYLIFFIPVLIKILS